ncbi:hypothetical protein BHF71_06365 [Vulcanibacillus modesticaldus]|uniref:Uncharacterized protein n=1 Tax=Vulcanibacillus modesticaldus TaxID=337097 RepID=A0A1D2YWP1_9BACI|nr:YlbF family regulator [Vulcanibacillus modesticaldus]OEG00066.1 hypothetical protein BHF71_06365 [Vulcanibacillus modesticaldus]
MQNLYDKAYELARMIENDQIYLDLKEITAKVKKNSEQVKLIDKYQQLQLKLQEKQSQGIQVSDEDLREVNDLYQKLISNPDIKKLFETEERFSILISDISKILTEPLVKISSKNTNNQ